MLLRAMSMIHEVIPAVLSAISMSKIMDEAGHTFERFKAECLAHRHFLVDKGKVESTVNERELLNTMDFQLLKTLCELKGVFNDTKVERSRVTAENVNHFSPHSCGDALELIRFVRNKVVCHAQNTKYNMTDIVNRMELAFNLLIKYGESTNTRDGTPFIDFLRKHPTLSEET
jgi:hypothetical protein